jgi:uncharacterized protein involved in exopolysaccharide biosynthesis
VPTLSLADRARVAVERFSIRNLTYALVASVLVAGLSAAVTLRAPAEYRSAAVLLIDNPLALASAGDDATENKLQQLRGKYATLANTELIAGPVADKLDMSVGAVIGATEVQPTPATLSLLVTAKGDDPARTQALAAAMSEEIGAYVQAEHETYGVAPADRFSIRVVQEATPAVQTSPSSDRALSSALVAFLVVLALAYFTLQLLRPPLAEGDRIDPD